MKNYIAINGQKIGLTEDQVERIRESLAVPTMKLADATPGDAVRVGDHSFVVLEHHANGTALILKDLLRKDVRFGDNNNYAGSNVEKICNEFADTIAGTVGADNVLLHDVDLTSDDGLKDYGVVKRRVSLLTTDLYRKYVEILDQHKIKAWWWLATPFSTPTHEDANWIKCVSQAGGINGDNCHYSGGVRPFCILNSNIFVSK